MFLLLLLLLLVLFFQAKYFGGWSCDPACAISHQQRRLQPPDAAFQIRAESVISTVGDDTPGRDCAEKGESSSDRLAVASALLSSGCQIRRVNYIEILSEMTDEICLCGLGVELQVIHDMR